MSLPELPGVITAAEITATAEAIADWQLPSGMIPWFPGGHADVWNHVEAAMALDIAGLHTEAEQAYQWLVDMQRPDGSWHQYYLADRVEQDKLDANCVAYSAAGVWHHWLRTGDRGFLEAMWPVVDPAIEFVLDLQTPRGEIRWARHADGTPWTFALLTGSSSMVHSLRCAVAIATELGHERPDWELGAARLAHVIRTEPDAFAAQTSLGDGLVLPGAGRRAARRRRAGPPGVTCRRVRTRRQGCAVRVGPSVGHHGRDLRMRHRVSRCRRPGQGIGAGRGDRAEPVRRWPLRHRHRLPADR